MTEGYKKYVTGAPGPTLSLQDQAKAKGEFARMELDPKPKPNPNPSQVPPQRVPAVTPMLTPSSSGRRPYPVSRGRFTLTSTSPRRSVRTRRTVAGMV